MERLSTTTTPDPQHVEFEHPSYNKYAVSKYKRPADRYRRLQKIESHKIIKGKQRYFYFYSYSFSLKLNGKQFKKRGGVRERKWRSV